MSREVWGGAVCVLALFLAAVFAAGSGLAAKGQAGDACGSRGLPVCGPQLFCDFQPSAMCGAADHPGTCRRRPEVCTRIYAPVCGCGDKTFGNDCERQAAGVGKLSDGPCK